ncbi:MAG: type transport system ATP-binding protein [Chloroflexota bacterium]|jgi:ABC-2 type transport system ATP-binding protein|nr:type transport system ATP-binding protein [Chloroflexota bacterium]
MQPSGPEAAIVASGLAKHYGRHVALHELTLTVPRGEVFGFLGPNGAGKTTAVKLLTGLARPTGGHGTVLGRPLGDRDARRRIGYLPELFRFQEWLNAVELLELHAELARYPRHAARRRIPEVIEMVGLAGRGADRVGTFSKGMQQRLGIAQALLCEPELVILDEPTSALDPIGRRDVRDLILDLAAQGTTVFLNSHLLSEVELVCDRVAFVNGGRVVREGRVEELLAAGHELRIRARGVDRSVLAALQARWRVLAQEGERLVVGVADADEAGAVVRCLVDRNVEVLELTPQRTNLEQLFLELVEGGQNGRVDLRTPDPARSSA